MPGSYGDFSQNLRVEVDVVVRRSALAEIVRQQSADGDQIQLPAWRITSQHLGDLIDAMLATLSGKESSSRWLIWLESTPSPLPGRASCTW